ncbi:MAG: outer membrane lipoprotein-sorting protein [Bdellovibrionales bacterium]|nr:outer membrane lipoprotein-sorting protein [Bdellovibrionales bacterium]
MKHTSIFFVLSFSFFFSSFSYAETPESKGLKIARMTEKANEGFIGEESDMEMILINAHGDRIERKMNSITKEIKNDGDKSLVTFLWPADVKGTKMLTWSHKEGSDDQWLYMPSHKRTRRISSRSQTGSFMASEFSYEDLGSQEIEKYKYKYIRDAKLNGRDTWVVEAYPKDKKSGYSKQVIWTDKDHKNPLKVEYYNRRSELLKTAEFQNYQKIKKWWRPEKIEMKNHQTKKASILMWKNRKLGKKFKDSEFHQKSLSR